MLAETAAGEPIQTGSRCYNPPAAPGSIVSEAAGKRSEAGRVKVAVCALTFRRPEGLERLLEGLASQRFPDRAARIQVVIVDNDTEPSAAPICRRWNERFEGGLRYVHEPRPGIATARNAALDVGLEDSDWIVFIDDDEVPEPDWLDGLLRAQARYGADVVAGPVVPDFEASPPQWVRDGGFYRTPRHRPGKRLRRAFTGNVMYRAAVLRKLRLRFEERLNFVGGEDTHFSEAIRRAGSAIVWTDEAVARHWIPEERMNERWLIQRKYRAGHVDAFIERELAPGLATTLALAGLGAAWIVSGVALLGVSQLAGHHWRVRAKRGLAYGLGLMRGLAGRTFEEYPRGERSNGRSPQDAPSRPSSLRTRSRPR
jgi:GT2 family glycosyltransferase